jgi:hypothetical protein
VLHSAALSANMGEPPVRKCHHRNDNDAPSTTWLHPKVQVIDFRQTNQGVFRVRKEPAPRSASCRRACCKCASGSHRTLDNRAALSTQAIKFSNPRSSSEGCFRGHQASPCQIRSSKSGEAYNPLSRSPNQKFWI